MIDRSPRLFRRVSVIMDYLSCPGRPVMIKEFLDYWVTLSYAEKRAHWDLIDKIQ